MEYGVWSEAGNRQWAMFQLNAYLLLLMRGIGHLAMCDSMEQTQSLLGHFVCIQVSNTNQQI